ncbi:MAG: formate dehydrogenase subunit alpha [Acetobacterium sp.]|uniref:formate dehydrogenase subunit alpha n=1 Tax=Acetobacterium sp. TaxID=1872094 RepID=UPI003241E071
MVNLTINGQNISVEPGTTILKAASSIGIEIPTLCSFKDFTPVGTCGMCVVEVAGSKEFEKACSTPVAEGMVVDTDTFAVRNERRKAMKALMVDHKFDCMACYKYEACFFVENNANLIDYDTYKAVGTEGYADRPIDDSNPFYTYDPSKCVLCGRCIKACDYLQCNHVLAAFDPEKDNIIKTVNDLPRGKTTECVSCGNCIAVCPTGALAPKKFKPFSYAKQVQTVCPYCGVGCTLNLKVVDNKITDVFSTEGNVNDNLLCVKGRFAYDFVGSPDRLTTPLIRKDGVLQEATWEEAITLVAKKLKEAKTEGPQAVAGFSSARCTNEDNYVFQKFIRTAGETNNVDHCARLCHASTVAGLAKSFGSGAMTNSIEEIAVMDVMLVSGSNTTETHPVIGAKIKQRKAQGAALIVAEPRKIELANYADVYLQIKPGTNVALFNGLMRAILDAGLEDKTFINERTEGYEAFLEFMNTITVEKCAEICGVDPDEMRKAGVLYATKDKGGIFYSMGVTQFNTGTDGVMSTANLAMLTGKIGREGCGVNPLRGQNNVQGSCDMGALPGDLPGYQKTANPEAVEKFEKAWGVKLPSNTGKTLTEIIDDVGNGTVKFLYVMGENPAVSDPNTNHVKEALKKANFIVVQDIFLTETTEFADVVLPAYVYAEKDGTFTNTERRIQLLRKAVDAPGTAKNDWEIIGMIAKEMGVKGFDFTSAAEIMDEIASVTPSYTGVSHERLNNGDRIQWPCLSKDSEGAKFLHAGKFTRGLGAFMIADYIPPEDQADEEYPLILMTGRILEHYHTRTMTKRSPGIEEIAGDAFVEINPAKALELGIEEGDIINVTSPRGSVSVKTRFNEGIMENNLFMPFHYGESGANSLTGGAVDPIAKIPPFKVSKVRVTK